MEKKVLQVTKLAKTYPERRGFFSREIKSPAFTAVDQISFVLNEGEILGVLGPNGAGKTSTIHMLLGILKPSSGKIVYFGKDFFTHRSQILKHVSHASAYTKLCSSLTVEENLDIMGRLHGLSVNDRRNRINHLLKKFNVEGLKGKQARMLSAGQTTRIMLVKAFLGDPKIVLLDEPTASLDPDIAKEAREFILEEQRQRKISVILTSHNMHEVALMCNRAIVIKKGRIIKEDSPRRLAKSVSLNQVIFSHLDGIEKAVAICTSKKLHYTVADGQLKVDILEEQMAHFLMEMAEAKIKYKTIDIKQPTLDDYFLTLTDRHKRGSTV